jgi:hypothetical protein
MSRRFATQIENYERPSPPEEKPMLYATDLEKIEYLYLRNWTVARIARRVGLLRGVIEKMCVEIDKKIEERVQQSPERIRAQHFGFHEQLAAEALSGYTASKYASDAPKNPKTGKRPKSEKGADPRFLRVAAENKAAARKIYGLDAASKTENINLVARAVFSPEEMARILGNPAARRAMTVIELALGDGETPPVADDGPLPWEPDPAPGGAA